MNGDANIFLSSEYVGTTKVKSTAPTEKFKVFLGIEDNIKVKRELIERSVEKGNALQGNIRRVSYAYRISVHNYANVSRKVGGCRIIAISGSGCCRLIYVSGRWLYRPYLQIQTSRLVPSAIPGILAEVPEARFVIVGKASGREQSYEEQLRDLAFDLGGASPAGFHGPSSRRS